jgi:uncharacterized membrane protein YcaP (DUF421 family)
MRSRKAKRVDDSSPDSIIDDGRVKRRRVKTSRFDFQFLDNEEQRLLQHVMIYNLKL